MHHIKHLKKVLVKKKKESFDAYLEAMRLVNRKTIPVCKQHHKDIHVGKFDGISLKKRGVGFNKTKA